MHVVRQYRLFPERRGPMIIANLNRAIGFYPRGQRVYLLSPEQMDDQEVRILARTILGRLDDTRVPWSALENVRIATVPREFAALATPAGFEQLQEWVARIGMTKLHDSRDWSVQIT